MTELHLETVAVTADDRGVVTVTLNRPDRNNAYNAALVEDVHAALDALADLPAARVVVLRANGRFFQAGADLRWVGEVAGTDYPNIHHWSARITELVRRIDALPQVVVAAVNGGCFGGGTGILAAADVVLAAADARYSIAEVRWGLTPSIIVPQLVDALGARNLRRYALTGETFDTAEAVRIGLVHESVPVGELDSRVAEVVAETLRSAPEAIATTKELVRNCSATAAAEQTFGGLVDIHARGRLSEEGRAGLQAFAAKETPPWAQ